VCQFLVGFLDPAARHRHRLSDSQLQINLPSFSLGSSSRGLTKTDRHQLQKDSYDNLYLAGYSHASWDRPVRAYTSSSDAFAAKLNSSGVLLWNTFLGGSGADFGFDLAALSSYEIYVVGKSSATW
jgi:hypothetical protein